MRIKRQLRSKFSRLNITKLFSTPTIVTIVKATTHETREIAWELLFLKLSVNQKKLKESPMVIFHVGIFCD